VTDARALLDELRPQIRDDRVLAAIAAVPRTAFVPPGREAEAWANQALEIGCGQTISQPLVVARMAELLDVRPGDRVLDVGTGSGYHAAILAVLGGRVWSVERHAELSAAAARALAAAGVRGVELVVADGSDGLPAHGPYDAVNIAAATPQDDLAPFEAQLAPGGRLIAPVVGRRRRQRLLLAERGPGGVVRTPLDEVRFVPLVRD
jgi:protein-L-isoaspartate(D-aspartate) O-methyltransferase